MILVSRYCTYECFQVRIYFTILYTTGMQAGISLILLLSYMAFTYCSRNMLVAGVSTVIFDFPGTQTVEKLLNFFSPPPPEYFRFAPLFRSHTFWVSQVNANLTTLRPLLQRKQNKRSNTKMAETFSLSKNVYSAGLVSSSTVIVMGRIFVKQIQHSSD